MLTFLSYTSEVGDFDKGGNPIETRRMKSEVVWDKTQKRALCRFKNGIYKTDDAAIIKELVARGYKCQEGDDAIAAIIGNQDKAKKE
jgi:hypothetical protein